MKVKQILRCAVLTALLCLTAAFAAERACAAEDTAEWPYADCTFTVQRTINGTKYSAYAYKDPSVADTFHLGFWSGKTPSVITLKAGSKPGYYKNVRYDRPPAGVSVPRHLERRGQSELRFP